MAHTPKSAQVARYALTMAVVFCLSWAAVKGYRWWALPSSMPTVSAPVPAAGGALPGVTNPQALGSVRLNLAVIHGGVQHSPGQTIALPSGSRFQLALESDTQGFARVFAINPAGVTSEIWHTQLAAGLGILSPEMRLEGQKGTEQLRVALTPSDARLPTIVRQVVIDHR